VSALRGCDQELYAPTFGLPHTHRCRWLIEFWVGRDCGKRTGPDGQFGGAPERGRDLQAARLGKQAESPRIVDADRETVSEADPLGLPKGRAHRAKNWRLYVNAEIEVDL